MFLCLVWGGGRAFLPACRVGSGVGSPDSQRITSSQVKSVCWAAARRLVGGRRFACVRVCYPAPEGLRQQIARLDTGGAVVLVGWVYMGTGPFFCVVGVYGRVL